MCFVFQSTLATEINNQKNRAIIKLIFNQDKSKNKNQLPTIKTA